MEKWVYLAFAVLSEVAGTISLKYSNGFTKLAPSVVVVVGYAISIYLLSLTLRHIPLAVTYAVWSGLGTALVAISGFIFFSETFTVLKAVSIVLIVVGVIGLNLTVAKT